MLAKQIKKPEIESLDRFKKLPMKSLMVKMGLSEHTNCLGYDLTRDFSLNILCLFQVYAKSWLLFTFFGGWLIELVGIIAESHLALPLT